MLRLYSDHMYFYSFTHPNHLLLLLTQPPHIQNYTKKQNEPKRKLEHFSRSEGLIKQKCHGHKNKNDRLYNNTTMMMMTTTAIFYICIGGIVWCMLFVHIRRSRVLIKYTRLPSSRSKHNRQKIII